MSFSRMLEYLLNIIYKLPRIEKNSIGTEYKSSMYKMLEDILIISKINKNDVLYHLNKIDARLNVQRIYLRIMKKEIKSLKSEIIHHKCSLTYI